MGYSYYEKIPTLENYKDEENKHKKHIFNRIDNILFTRIN